jgi:hypothetical protein
MKLIQELHAHIYAMEAKIEGLDNKILDACISHEERVSASEERRALIVKIEEAEHSLRKLLM